MHYIDLTKKLDESTLIYSEVDYIDPPFNISEWCKVPDQGFNVSKICMGTQTGTHIDAPAHFLDGGNTLECLDISDMIGNYWLLNEIQINRLSISEITESNKNEKFIFLCNATGNSFKLDKDKLHALLSLPIKVWIIMQEIEVVGEDDYCFYRALAEKDKYLIEDLKYIESIPENGEITALPLNLQKVSGSPCRVILGYD